MNSLSKFSVLLLSGLISITAFGGEIYGVVRVKDSALPGVMVTAKQANGPAASAMTTADGRYRLLNLAEGDYVVAVAPQGLPGQTRDVKVPATGKVEVNFTLEGGMNLMESMTVSSASRRIERIVEAPAAVSVVTSEEILNTAATGQIPRLLESVPGIELNQSGVQDFNINARGFNSSLNRRVLVLVDGRDPAIAFLGNQEWASLSLPMEEFEKVEFVRGPGSALYGANAFNGVLNITTKRPSDSTGGLASISLGEMSTYEGTIRYAHDFGNGWALRVNAGGGSAESWDRSRTAADAPFEYEGLTPEVLPFDREYTNAAGVTNKLENKYERLFYGLRIDKEFNNGHLLSLEHGFSNSGGGVVVTGIGRVFIEESERPWYRINYNMPHLNLMYWRTERNTPEVQTSLASGGGFYEDSVIDHLEMQFNWEFGEWVDLVAGGSYHEESVDTANPNGFQTLMLAPHDEDETGYFAQLTGHLGEYVDLVVAGRYDNSSLHDSVTSPKAALVYKINPNHTLRATYNEAFQTPTYSEFFLRAPSTIIPFNQIEAAIEGILSQSTGQQVDLPLNWSAVPAMALGNENLKVEKNETIELGYKGIIGSKLFLTLDLYKSDISDFVTDLLPGVNPDIEAFDYNSLGLDPATTGLVRFIMSQALPPALLAGLTAGNANTVPFVRVGHPTVAVSYTNAGQVDITGGELSFRYYFSDSWTMEGSWSEVIDFEVNGLQAGDRLLLNGSERKYDLGGSYTRNNISANLQYKHVDGFPWAAGAFFSPAGQDVPSWDLVNLGFSYKVTDRIRLTANVHNALDEEHYESFGGTMLGRRAVAGAQISF